MSVIEKTIEYFAPRSALKRKAAKIRLRSLEAASRKPRIAHWGAHEKTKIDSKDIKTLRERSRHLTIKSKEWQNLSGKISTKNQRNTNEESYQKMFQLS